MPYAGELAIVVLWAKSSYVNKSWDEYLNCNLSLTRYWCPSLTNL